MKTRIITGVIGAVICILVMVFGEMWPLLFAIAIAVVNGIISMEFLTAKNLQKSIPIMILTLLFAVSMPVTVAFKLWYIPLILYSLSMFVLLVICFRKVTVADITFAYAGEVFITLTMSAMSRMVISFGGWYSFILVVSLIGAWGADTSAYFVGSALGKHKLCPSISPKKTVEGAIGGALGSVVFTVISGVIFQYIVYRDMTVNYLALLVIGLYCAVFSVFGDLFFSVIKRECGIKDYGSIMPGHGGLLDRFDSVLFCVPFVYFINQIWWLVA